MQSQDSCAGNENFPLDALFILSSPVQVEDPEISIERATGADAMMQLLGQCFVADVTDRNLMAKQFDKVGQLIRNVECYLLRYPRKHERLYETRAAVAKVLA
jgi:hypothetical protein